ncbi:MAG: hypothetical protein IIW10_01200 [Spirochaetaceae bacterium]|nr:hypothetical protein [Spirochaetaceae bacterium]
MSFCLFILFFISSFTFPLFAHETQLSALESKVYAQSDKLEIIENFYSAAKEKSNSISDEVKRLVFLSRCDELLGRYHIFLGDLTAAREVFRQGIANAEKALSIKETADAQEALVMNISQNMRCENTAYMLKHGLRLQGMIKKIYELNKDSQWAKYFEITQNVYAPKGFGNAKKGKQSVNELLSDEKNLSAGLRFNAWTAKAKAHILLKEWDEAKNALAMAEKIFPKNAEVASLKTELRQHK